MVFNAGCQLVCLRRELLLRQQTLNGRLHVCFSCPIRPCQNACATGCDRVYVEELIHVAGDTQDWHAIAQSLVVGRTTAVTHQQAGVATELITGQEIKYVG